MSRNRGSYSPKQLADELGVSVQTVQRWADAGHLKAWKTLGGHRKIDAESAGELIRANRAAGGEARPAAAARVLLVDDDPAALQVAEMLVEATLPGARISKAQNGFHALQTMGQVTPDVLVTDILMPHIDGFEMLRHLAAQPRRPALVIVTSVMSLEEVQRNGGLPAGVVFLPKPLDLAAFAALLLALPAI